MSLRTNGSSGQGNPTLRKIDILTFDKHANFEGMGNASTLVRLFKGKTIANVVTDPNMKSVEFHTSDRTVIRFYEDFPGPTIACFLFK